MLSNNLSGSRWFITPILMSLANRVSALRIGNIPMSRSTVEIRLYPDSPSLIYEGLPFFN